MVFKMAEKGDRVLITFPDVYSFLGVTQWIAEVFGDIFWILWTDAAIERLEHFSKKYGFPISGDAIAMFTRKKCKCLNIVDYLDAQSDLAMFLNSFPIDGKIVVSFGIDFLEIYGYDINKAVEAIVSCDGENVFVTALLNNRLVDKLLPFHDYYIEITESKDTYISYRTYTASLRFSIKGGVAVMSNSFLLEPKKGCGGDESFGR